MVNDGSCDDDSYDPNEIKNTCNSSYILNDWGFTLISNSHAPFFSVYPEPECGFGKTIGDGEEMRKIFEALSSPETMRALLYIYKQEEKFVFESAILVGKCNIGESKIDSVMDDLLSLRVVYKRELSINGESRVLYYSCQHHNIIALFLIAHEINYKGAYSLQAHHRNKPYLK